MKDELVTDRMCVSTGHTVSRLNILPFPSLCPFQVSTRRVLPVSPNVQQPGRGGEWGSCEACPFQSCRSFSNVLGIFVVFGLSDTFHSK